MFLIRGNHESRQITQVSCCYVFDIVDFDDVVAYNLCRVMLSGRDHVHTISRSLRQSPLWVVVSVTILKIIQKNLFNLATLLVLNPGLRLLRRVPAQVRLGQRLALL